MAKREAAAILRWVGKGEGSLARFAAWQMPRLAWGGDERKRTQEIQNQLYGRKIQRFSRWDPKRLS